MAKNNNIKKPKPMEVNRIQIKEPPQDSSQLKPIFSFYHMRYGKSYCLSQCGRDDKSNLANLLLQLSQQTWSNISSSHRKNFGYEHIPIKKFKTKVFPDVVTPDVKSLLVFAYSHGGRMAGIQYKDIFHILLVGDNLYKH